MFSGLTIDIRQAVRALKRECDHGTSLGKVVGCLAPEARCPEHREVVPRLAPAILRLPQGDAVSLVEGGKSGTFFDRAGQGGCGGEHPESSLQVGRMLPAGSHCAPLLRGGRRNLEFERAIRTKGPVHSVGFYFRLVGLCV